MAGPCGFHRLCHGFAHAAHVAARSCLELAHVACLVRLVTLPNPLHAGNLESGIVPILCCLITVPHSVSFGNASQPQMGMRCNLACECKCESQLFRRAEGLVCRWGDAHTGSFGLRPCLISGSPKNFNFVEDCKLAKPRHYGPRQSRHCPRAERANQLSVLQFFCKVTGSSMAKPIGFIPAKFNHIGYELSLPKIKMDGIEKHWINSYLIQLNCLGWLALIIGKRVSD